MNASEYIASAKNIEENYLLAEASDHEKWNNRRQKNRCSVMVFRQRNEAKTETAKRASEASSKARS